MKEKLLSLKNKPVVLLAAAAVLLILSTVGATQAAITSYSEEYTTTMKAPTVEVSLVENDEIVKVNESDGSMVLLSKMLEQSDGKLIPGKSYEEELKVQNTGSADAYVRVVITKNWLKSSGDVDRELSPSNIEMNLVNTGDWLEDTTAATAERTVLYLNKVLPADGENSITSLFMENVKVRSGFDLIVKEESVVTKKVGETEYKTISYSHPYDGYEMNITVEVDAVQTYDAKEAIKSAWGIDVEVSEADGSLTFKF